MSDIEDKMAQLQAEVDEQFDDVERSTQKKDETRAAEKKQAKEEFVDELTSLGDEIKKKALVKTAKGTLAKISGTKAIVAGVGVLLLILFILKNIWFILFGALGLGALWYVLSEWSKEDDEDSDKSEE